MPRLISPCLVVVDVQERLVQVMADRDLLIKRIEIMIQAARLLGLPIVLTQQKPQSLGPTIPQLARHLEGIEPVNKTYFSCWAEPQFRARLQDLHAKDVVLCGIEAHVCIYQTASDLIRHGFNVHVPSDAISSRSIQDRQNAIWRMAWEGARISSTEMTIFELLETADHALFKQVSRLMIK